jgi:hypothetical protein
MIKANKPMSKRHFIEFFVVCVFDIFFLGTKKRGTVGRKLDFWCFLFVVEKWGTVRVPRLNAANVEQKRMRFLNVKFFPFGNQKTSKRAKNVEARFCEHQLLDAFLHFSRVFLFVWLLIY